MTMTNAALKHNTPVTNSLLLERNLTKSIWKEPKNLAQALDEILALVHLDRDSAMLKITCLYGMARVEYESHFNLKFDPYAVEHPKATPNGQKLIDYCLSLYATLKHLRLVA